MSQHPLLSDPEITYKCEPIKRGYIETKTYDVNRYEGKISVMIADSYVKDLQSIVLICDKYYESYIPLDLLYSLGEGENFSFKKEGLWLKLIFDADNVTYILNQNEKENVSIFVKELGEHEPIPKSVKLNSYITDSYKLYRNSGNGKIEGNHIILVSKSPLNFILAEEKTTLNLYENHYTLTHYELNGMYYYNITSIIRRKRRILCSGNDSNSLHIITT